MRGSRAITMWKYLFIFEFCSALAIKEGDDLTLICSQGLFSEMALFKSTSDTSEIITRAGGMERTAGLTKGLSPPSLSYRETFMYGSFASRKVTIKRDDGLHLVLPSKRTDSGTYYCISCYQSGRVTLVNITVITVHNSHRDSSDHAEPKTSSSNVHDKYTIEWCGITLLELAQGVPSLRRFQSLTSIAKRAPRVDVPVIIPQTKTTKRTPSLQAPVTVPRTKTTKRAPSVDITDTGPLTRATERAPGAGAAEPALERQFEYFSPEDFDVYVEQRDHIGTYVSFSVFLCCVFLCVVRIIKRNV